MEIKYRKNEMFLFEEISIIDNKYIDTAIIEHFNNINEQKRIIKKMKLNYPNSIFNYKDIIIFKDVPNLVIDIIEIEIISSNATSKKVVVKCEEHVLLNL